MLKNDPENILHGDFGQGGAVVAHSLRHWFTKWKVGTLKFHFTFGGIFNRLHKKWWT